MVRLSEPAMLGRTLEVDGLPARVLLLRTVRSKR